MESLCDSCGVTNEKGEPCEIMFSKDKVEHCSVYINNEKAHKKLADRLGSSKKDGDQKRK